MKLAYLILAHNNVEQLMRLIEKLDEKSNTFIIHFDKKGSNDDYNELTNNYRNVDNVYFVERMKCYWGDFSLVRATLICIQYIFNLNKEFDYAILLSGQDYPIVNNERIKRFFEIHNGKQFIQYFNPEKVWGSNERVNYIHFNKNNYLRKLFQNLKIKRRSYPFDKFYGGGQWWCLSRDCLQYILDFTQKNRKIVAFFKYAHIPDELFFQTILLNSPFMSQVKNNHLRYIDWTGDPAPKTLNVEDYPKLESSGKLFARKFNIHTDMEVLNKIDRFLIAGKQ